MNTFKAKYTNHLEIPRNSYVIQLVTVISEICENFQDSTVL